MNPLAAGIDIGDREIYVAVPPQSTTADKVVRNFGTFTNDLAAIADWLKECGVTTVALESTGIYWVPLFELLVRGGEPLAAVDAVQEHIHRLHRLWDMMNLWVQPGSREARDRHRIDFAPLPLK